MGATPLCPVCKKWRYTHKHTHKRGKVALQPYTHTQTGQSGVAPINTHTRVKKWRYTHGYNAPFLRVCVCVYGCNTTFSRLCVCLWVQRHFFTFVCVLLDVTPLSRTKVTLHPLTHTQTRQSGVAPINKHTHVKKLRCTHKYTHTRKKVTLHRLWVQRHFFTFVCVNGCNATFLRVCVCVFMGATPLFHVWWRYTH
jgi:hypothetical protein